MPYRSVEIANEFLGKPHGGGLTQMQLQKLAYISHGWNLAINGRPLAADPVEAWDYGPVFPELYHHAKFFGSSPLGRKITPDDENAIAFFMSDKKSEAKPYKAEFDQTEGEIIDHVWRRFGEFSAFRLSELTHKPGTPWYQTYFGKGKSAVIGNEVIRNHYLRLAGVDQSSA